MPIGLDAVNTLFSPNLHCSFFIQRPILTQRQGTVSLWFCRKQGDTITHRFRLGFQRAEPISHPSDHWPTQILPWATPLWVKPSPTQPFVIQGPFQTSPLQAHQNSQSLNPINYGPLIRPKWKWPLKRSTSVFFFNVWRPNMSGG